MGQHSERCICSASKCVGRDGIILQKHRVVSETLPLRDSSALSATVAALTTAQEGVHPACATQNCNAANDPLIALPSDSLPVKQAKKNLRNIVDSLQAKMCDEVVSHFDRVKSVSDWIVSLSLFHTL